MKVNRIKSIILFICLVWIVGCQSDGTLKPMTFKEIYPGSLSDVTKIEIRHGDGELKSITDVEIIEDWLDSIKDITFEPDENQEGTVGYLYSVKLFEGNDMKLFFDTSEIDGIYYKPNNQIKERIEKLFNED